MTFTNNNYLKIHINHHYPIRTKQLTNNHLKNPYQPSIPNNKSNNLLHKPIHPQTQKNQTQKMKNQLFILFIIFIIFQAKYSDAWFMQNKKVHVVIVNDINTVVKIHCRSGQNDLKEHELQFKQTFPFSFRPQILGGTVFHCSFQWPNHNIPKLNVYDDHLDDIMTSRTFKWSVRANSVCLVDGDSSRDVKCF